jgi:hypothetical protein
MCIASPTSEWTKNQLAKISLLLCIHPSPELITVWHTLCGVAGVAIKKTIRRLRVMKTRRLRPRLTRSHKLQVLVRTLTFSAINSHLSTRFLVDSSNNSSSIGSPSPYKACRMRTWRTCSRRIRSTTWTLRRTSSGSSSTTCHPPKTRSSSNTFNNNSQHVNNTHRRALTVPWATRTRTGTGSFLEKKFCLISSCISRLPDS